MTQNSCISRVSITDGRGFFRNLSKYDSIPEDNGSIRTSARQPRQIGRLETRGGLAKAIRHPFDLLRQNDFSIMYAIFGNKIPFFKLEISTKRNFIFLKLKTKNCGQAIDQTRFADLCLRKDSKKPHSFTGHPIASHLLLLCRSVVIAL